MSEKFEEFLLLCQQACDYASKMQNPLIIHHYDADGISSGAIVSLWFEKQKKPYRRIWVKKLDPAFIKSISNEENLIFVDLGSSSKFLEDLKNNVLIIDHHQIECKAHFQVNPHLFGFDGGKEISSSGCAFFTFGKDSDLGIVGAIGDMQKFISLNKKMLDILINQGFVEVSVDLLLFGKKSRPLIQLLAYADEPYLPGLTGHEDECAKFLFDLGIELKKGDKWRTYADLSYEEKKKLISGLAELLVFRVSPQASQKLVGEVYTLLKRPYFSELSDASEFATVLNACGRNGKADLGFEVCLSKEGAYEKAKALLAEHRKNLKEGILFAEKNIQDFGKFLFLDGRGVISDSIIGVIAGMVFPGKKAKPILAISFDEEGNIKLSTRATAKLVSEGINLGKIVSLSTQKVGGVGGGHNIAAGGTIPKEKLNEFLLEFSNQL